MRAGDLLYFGFRLIERHYRSLLFGNRYTDLPPAADILEIERRPSTARTCKISSLASFQLFAHSHSCHTDPDQPCAAVRPITPTCRSGCPPRCEKKGESLHF